jgi:hypothetical protein
MLLLGVVADWQTQFVAHENEVAGDGIRRDIQERGQLGAVHEPRVLKFLMDGRIMRASGGLEWGNWDKPKSGNFEICAFFRVNRSTEKGVNH